MGALDRFAANVRRRRLALGLSQEVLAARAGLDRTYLSGLERGARNPTLPKQMWDGIRTEIDPTVAAVSTLLIAVTTTVLAAITLVRRRAEEDVA